MEDVLLGRHTASNTDQVVSLYPEGIEMHPHQEDMHYGKRSTCVSFCVCDMYIISIMFIYDTLTFSTYLLFKLLNCDRDEYDILRQFGRDKAAFPISKASLRHNRHIKPILFEFAPKAAQLIIDAGLARDLNNIDLSSTPAASRRGKFGILYALYNKDGILIKIGITFNVDERKEEYRKEFPAIDEKIFTLDMPVSKYCGFIALVYNKEVLQNIKFIAKILYTYVKRK